MIKDKTIFIAHNWSDVSVCQQSKALALSLSKTNKVFFLNAKRNTTDKFKINENLTVLGWPGKRPTGLKDLLFAIRLFRKHKPDIIVTNFASNDIMLFVSWMFATKARVCYFHTMVEQHIADKGTLSLRQKMNIWRKSQVFNKATHMLPCSSAAAKDLLKYYSGIDRRKVHIFPNALYDTDKINTGKRFTVGFIGRLDRSKGVDILVKAFVQLQQSFPELKLVIAGNGVMEQELKRLISEAGVKDKVDWRGAISYTDVLHFVSNLSFLVVPSRTDNLPTVVLEAFSTNTPVIGAKAGGIPDMIQDGYNGRLFEKENVDDLVLKMKSLLEDEELGKAMGENARQTFKEKYCTENLQQRFEKLLAETGSL